jgi:hypothetical protein
MKLPINDITSYLQASDGAFYNILYMFIPQSITKLLKFEGENYCLHMKKMMMATLSTVKAYPVANIVTNS